MINPLHIGMSSENSSLGGLNRFARELTLAQREQGINASLLGNGERSNLFEYGISYDGKDFNSKVQYFNKRRIIQKITKDYDLLDIHFSLQVLPTLGLRIPTIIHFHGPWYLESMQMKQIRVKVLAKQLIENFVYRTNTQFITLSRAFADVLIDKFDVNHKIIEIIPPGIRTQRRNFSSEERESFRRRFNLDHDEPFVITVRRLVPRMGLEILIDAIAGLEIPPKVLIIGDGPLRESLNMRIGDLRMSKVIQVTGKLDEEDLHLAYELSSLSILPTIALEGFGLSALESMSFGTPVITTRCGGLVELMEGLPSNFLIPPNSVVDLRNAIQEFFQEKKDFESLFLSHANKYSWENVVKETNNCYEKQIK